MINASIQTRVGWTSPVVKKSRRFYIDTEADGPLHAADLSLRD
jgi:hypothetical protein